MDLKRCDAGYCTMLAVEGGRFCSGHTKNMGKHNKMRLVEDDGRESKSTVCYQCGVRRPITGMLQVCLMTPKEVEEDMLFCNWKCLSNYALDAVTP